MKKLSILIFIISISCVKKTQEKTETIIKPKEVIEVITPAHKIENSINFKDVINSTKTRPIPIKETTNFDSFIEEGDYNNVEVQALKLIEVYPNFYKQGYNYRAIASYKINYSSDFYTVVVTTLKGDHEMETVLITYSLIGNIINYKVVSYDEIAEGIFKIESKIEQDKLTITSIADLEEKSETIEVFTIKSNGKIEPEASKNNLVSDVIQQLKLDPLKVNHDFVTTKVQPHNPDETIVVIPEIVGEYDDNGFELNSYILLVDSNTNKITHKYFESSKTNGWESDAIMLSEITIDTAPYQLNENTRAFGIVVYHYGMSRPNPYGNKTISLFVKSTNGIKRVLRHYDVMNNYGEWDTNCAGEFKDVKNTLIISRKATNGYFDIIVKSKITESEAYVDENGDCDSKDKITAETNWLKFNGESYNNAICKFTPLELYIDHSNVDIADIRNKPNGEVLLNIDKQGEYTVTVSEVSEDWLKVTKLVEVDAGVIKIPNGYGWIHNSVIGASITKDITVFDNPNTNEAISAIKKETRVKIINICSDWVRIERGSTIGWVESEWLCGNPVTTCP